MVVAHESKRAEEPITQRKIPTLILSKRPAGTKAAVMSEAERQELLQEKRVLVAWAKARNDQMERSAEATALLESIQSQDSQVVDDLNAEQQWDMVHEITQKAETAGLSEEIFINLMVQHDSQTEAMDTSEGEKKNDSPELAVQPPETGHPLKGTMDRAEQRTKQREAAIKEAQERAEKARLDIEKLTNEPYIEPLQQSKVSRKLTDADYLSPTECSESDPDIEQECRDAPKSYALLKNLKREAKLAKQGINTSLNLAAEARGLIGPNLTVFKPGRWSPGRLAQELTKLRDSGKLKGTGYLYLHLQGTPMRVFLELEQAWVKVKEVIKAWNWHIEAALDSPTENAGQHKQSRELLKWMITYGNTLCEEAQGEYFHFTLQYPKKRMPTRNSKVDSTADHWTLCYYEDNNEKIVIGKCEYDHPNLRQTYTFNRTLLQILRIDRKTLRQVLEEEMTQFYVFELKTVSEPIPLLTRAAPTKTEEDEAEEEAPPPLKSLKNEERPPSKGKDKGKGKGKGGKSKKKAENAGITRFADKGNSGGSHSKGGKDKGRSKGNKPTYLQVGTTFVPKQEYHNDPSWYDTSTPTPAATSTVDPYAAMKRKLDS